MSTMMIPGYNNTSYGSYGPYSGGHPGMGGPGMNLPGMGGPGMGYPGIPGGGEYNQTLQDSHTGGARIGGGGFFGGFQVQPNEGYGLDFNRNGRYDRGRDGVLVFDTNRDGRYDRKDVQSTNDMMKASTGNFDFNNDGKIGFGERIKGSMLKRQFAQLDRNRDGRLTSDEISQGGGRVWMDQDRNGKVGFGETSSVYNVPANGRFGPTERLDYVDPFRQTSHTTDNPSWQNPGFNGGGYPGCGCGGGGWNQAQPSYQNNGVGYFGAY